MIMAEISTTMMIFEIITTTTVMIMVVVFTVSLMMVTKKMAMVVTDAAEDYNGERLLIMKMFVLKVRQNEEVMLVS